MMKIKPPVLLILLALVALLAVGGMVLHYHTLTLKPDAVALYLNELNNQPMVFPWVLAIYLVAGLVVFPIVVLNLACAMAFGPVWGVLYGYAGSLLSAFVYFWAGRALRRMPHVRAFFEQGRPSVIDKKLKDAGVTGVAVLRLVPIAPFTIFNVTGGISSIHFLPFFAGTALSLIPGVFVRGLLGVSLVQFILHPDAKTAAMVIGGLAFWLVVVYTCNALVKRWRQTATDGKNAPA